MELGISQTALAKMVGISKQTLYKYEKGIVKNIPVDTAEALAYALNTTPAFIIGWEEDRDEEKVFDAYLSEDEKELLRKYRQLFDKQKERIIKSVNNEYRKMMNETNSKR